MEIWIGAAIIVVVALLCLASIRISERHGLAVQRATYREAYRRGIIAGYAKCERKWRHRKAVELHDANRRTDAREDAAGTATVSKINIHSRP